MGDAREDGGFVGGFTGALTWENIGKQVATGLISGAAGGVTGSVVSSLMGRLLSDGESVEEMMQRFVDEIVGRLTTEVKNIVNEAFFQFSVQKVKTSTAALGEKYVAFETTQDVPLLDAAVDHSFDAVEEAIALGSVGLGTFVVTGGLKLCLLEEKAKTNNSFHDVALREVERLSGVVERFTEELLAANDRAVGQFHGCRHPVGEFMQCFIHVDGVVKVEEFHPPPPPPNFPLARQRFVDQLNFVTRQEIIDPALEIVETWKELD